jgi:hypothetical protein
VYSTDWRPLVFEGGRAAGGGAAVLERDGKRSIVTWGVGVLLGLRVEAELVGPASPLFGWVLVGPVRGAPLRVGVS